MIAVDFPPFVILQEPPQDDDRKSEEEFNEDVLRTDAYLEEFGADMARENEQ